MGRKIHIGRINLHGTHELALENTVSIFNATSDIGTFPNKF